MKLITLISIDIILIMINIILIFIFLPTILKILNERIKWLRAFIEKNEGFFSLSFICLFGLEQAILILFISFSKNLDLLKFIVSFFALVVITTATIQKFIFDKKREYERKTKNYTKNSKEIIIEQSGFIKDILKELKKKE
jgi:hypothetical protein